MTAKEPLWAMTVAEAARAIRSREVSSVELTEAVLARIASTQPLIHAYAEVTAEAAREQAREADARPAASPLHGVPVAVKDLIDVAGVPTRAGSRLRAGAQPAERDARVVTLLRAAGAVIVGKTHTHELALGTTTPPVRNPWALSRIPGGSSGGSGAAVAAGACIAAIGTDTGCSIRCPAALTGVAGLKPTYGRVSRTGVLPVSWGHDHVGPLARTSVDCGLVLNAVAGHDPADRSSSRRPVDDATAGAGAGLRGITVGVPQDAFFQAVEPAVARGVAGAVDALGAAGARIVALRLPHIELGVAVVRVCALVESAARHRRDARGRERLYSDVVRSLLEAGQLVPAADYVDALRVRQVLKDAVRAAWQEHAIDVLVTPSSPVTALPAGVEAHRIGDEPELAVDLHHMAFQSPFDATGQPALSVPCGFDDDGLPVGMQIVGRPFDEATVIRVGAGFEQVTDWHRRKPPL